MVQKIWNWVFVLLAAMYMPNTMYVGLSASHVQAEISVSYSGIVEFLGIFANPEYYLDAEEIVQGDELDEIRTKAEEITKNYSSSYEKIYAVMVYVADNTYYDYQYLEGIEFRSQAAYDVFTSKLGVCQGYSDLASVMLRSIGIPCMTATSTTHAYNFAHDGSRWVFFDPTWCSCNMFTVAGEMLHEGYTDKYFDLDSNEIIDLGKSHQTFAITCGKTTATLDWNSNTAVITS